MKVFKTLDIRLHWTVIPERHTTNEMEKHKLVLAIIENPTLQKISLKEKVTHRKKNIFKACT